MKVFNVAYHEETLFNGEAYVLHKQYENEVEQQYYRSHFTRSVKCSVRADTHATCSSQSYIKQGVFVRRVVCPGGSLSGGTCLERHLHRGIYALGAIFLFVKVAGNAEVTIMF